MSITTNSAQTTEPTAQAGDNTAARHGRLNIKINAATSQALRQLASDDDATPTEVIRRAVALLKLVDDKRRRNQQHIEFVSEDGKTRERLELLY